MFHSICETFTSHYFPASLHLRHEMKGEEWPQLAMFSLALENLIKLSKSGIGNLFLAANRVDTGCRLHPALRAAVRGLREAVNGYTNVCSGYTKVIVIITYFLSSHLDRYK